MYTMTKEDTIKILVDLKSNPFLHTWEEIEKALNMAIESMSADKVEVVRCKDCRWNTHYPFCDIDRDDDFFCADGAREEK